ncbi:rhodanese-like domain-containing protein [Poritiphilus flavus]|uniref:Rhodanese-like domain-containing protein n=1 Tax=Poritiphilus flavus TaxID=2697053 RepID=A0A6L9EHC0_9FLAO|nr:rhodanese-like domain-containing protein [Poritiphilus flavus]NAS14164.1 rhodanese-like domain-containing protein [Poritiphilus flavus]
MKTQYLWVILVLIHLNCTQIKSKPITEFSQKDIKSGLLVDVRTPEEFANGHLENARNVNWLADGFQSYFDSIPKDRTIFLYCKKGGRSSKAAAVLDSLGFEVVDLIGGYDAFIKNQIN